MTDQFRIWKVLLVLLISMTGGAILLMCLGNNPPSAGAFSLSSYYKLESPDKAVSTCKPQNSNLWQRIEITHSGTQVGNIEMLSSLEGLTDPAQFNAHFVICNGVGGEDGEIQATERWYHQRAAIPRQNWGQQSHTIRICVVSDAPSTPPTNCQIRRVGVLVQILCRKFNIQTEYVRWPGDLNEG